MENNLKKHEYNNNGALNIIFGALIGGLVGAIAMLLFAPQSGKQTRDQIQNKSIEIRDRTTKDIKKTFEKVRSETGKITNEIKEKAGELKQLSQDKLVEQLDRVSNALDDGRKAVKAA
jgi:gas vesicle protein